MYEEGGRDDIEVLVRHIAESSDKEHMDRLYNALYKDLLRIARSLVSQQRQPVFSPTSLISEAWLRLARAEVRLSDREHFVSLVAKAMRFAIVDQVRKGYAVRHGANSVFVPIDETVEPASQMHLEQLLALHTGLTKLEVLDPRAAKVVELNYFAGISMAQAAELLGVTERTIRRDWRRARAFLLAEAIPLSDAMGDGAMDAD